MNYCQKRIGEAPIHIGDGNYSSKYPKASDFISSGVPFFSATDVTNGRLNPFQVRYIRPEQHFTLKKGHLKKNDVLIVTRGNGIGNVALVDEVYEGANINAQLVLLRADEKELHSIYLYYLLFSPEYFELLKNYGSGSAQPQLTITSLQEVPLKYPPYKEQIKIAKMMILLDDKIFLNYEINTSLEELAQTIFKSWFVNFDPIHAKKLALEKGLSKKQAERAAMAIISGVCSPKNFAENFKEMNKKLSHKLSKMNKEQQDELAHTASLFPSEFVDSELGEIPKEWSVKKFKEMVDILNGFAFKSSDYSRDGVFVLRTKNFDDSNLVERLKDDVYLPEAFLNSHDKHICQDLDYHLIMVGASIGKTGMIFKYQLPALRNQNMWCFRPLDTFIYHGFCKYSLDELVNANLSFASGSARFFFRKGDFFNGKAVAPTAEILSAFENVAKPILEKKGLNLAENEQLEQLRDTLLPKLLAGEIDLSNIKLKERN